MADIERKAALVARVQSLRASAAEELQFVADEIEPYANFDEAMTAEQIQDDLDGIEVTKESLAAIKGQVDAIIVEMEAARDDADAAISEAEDLQSDVDLAIEECTRLMATGVAQIGAKSMTANIERKAAGVDLSELDKMAAEIDRAVAQYDALSGLITDDLNADPSDPAEIAALIERLKSYIPMVRPYRDFIVNASAAVDALSDDATTRITAAVDEMQDKISQIDGAEYVQPEDLQFDIEIRIQELETGEKSGKVAVARKSAPLTAATRLAAMADLLPGLIEDAADPALDAETKSEVRAAIAAQSAALDRMAREAIAAGHDALATEIVAARAGLPVAA